jgi:hypothetical protein
MPKAFTQYSVFIGSPGGLAQERERFRDLLRRFTSLHAEPRGVTFEPVGWEDTVIGAGRPQELINRDLKKCDYAVFLLHDHWGTPPGGRASSGTEEEWKLAERLYRERQMRDVLLFFKQVDPERERDPGKDLRKVLEFKREIEAGRKYLFKMYPSPEIFSNYLEANLAQWLRDHEDIERSALQRAAGRGGRAQPRTAQSAGRRKPAERAGRGRKTAARRGSSR